MRVPSLTDDDPQLGPAVRAERNRMLFAHTASICTVSLIVSMVVALVIYNQDNASRVWVWFAAKVITVVLRLVHLQAYRRSSDHDAPIWRASLVAVLALDALVWGLGSYWMMFNDSLTEAAVIVVTSVAASAITTLVLQSDMLCNAAFNVPLLVPLVIGLFQRGDLFGLYSGAGGAIFLVLMILEGHRAELRIIELVSLRCTTDRIAQQLSEALRQAQLHSAYKSQFLANMSHEMRTPLHGILGLTRLLRQRQSERDVLKQFDLVERSGEHLLNVINDVLDLSRIEAGRMVIQSQVFDLRELIDDVATLSGVNIRGKGLELVTHFELPSPCYVMGDPARVRQVLHNLLGNAIKFTEEGHISLRVSRDQIGGHVTMEIEDTGIGISPTDLPRIFEAFTQAESSFDRRFGGTGLGLTISRELGRAMGGDIVCTSQVGTGSRFVFRVPLPPVAAPVSTPLVPVSRDDRLQGHVLLAEDNEVNAMVAHATLERLGLKVDTVENGEQAVAYMYKHEPDLVLMDCQMPQVDGFEATRQIREIESRLHRVRVPIVALTANALEGDRERCLTAGMDDHLSKPFKDEDLEQVLRRYLRSVRPVPSESASSERNVA
jgi:signal transduction histidine kinase/ActR/RegA family two-component response regulator